MLKREKDYKGFSGVYKITNLVNGKFYIGSCSCFYTRKSAHKSLLNNNKHHSKYLQRAWNKYGEENFEFKLLITIPKKKDYLLGIEQWFLDNTSPNYNICKIAGSSLGRIFSEEHKLKLSEANKGKKRTEEQKLHQSLVKLGTTHSQETKDKCRDISNNLKGNRTNDKINKEEILSVINKINMQYIDKTIKQICTEYNFNYRSVLKFINNTTWKEFHYLVLPEAISNLKNQSISKIKQYKNGLSIHL